MKFGADDPTTFFVGADEVDKIYLGTDEVWPVIPPGLGTMAFVGSSKGFAFGNGGVNQVVTTTLPTGTAANDFLVASLSFERVAIPNTPTGWTLIHYISDPNYTLALYATKVTSTMVSTGSASFQNTTNNAIWMKLGLTLFRPSSGTLSSFSVVSATEGSGLTASLPTSDVVVMAGGNNSGNNNAEASFDPPTGMTESVDAPWAAAPMGRISHALAYGIGVAGGGYTMNTGPLGRMYIGCGFDFT
jgi:hypothetical protein